jgi:hypothetical protein
LRATAAKKLTERSISLSTAPHYSPSTAKDSHVTPGPARHPLQSCPRTQRSRRRRGNPYLDENAVPEPFAYPARLGRPSVKISRLASRAFRLAGLVAGLGLTALAANQRSQASRRMASNTSASAGPGHLDATAGRTVVFCHACHNEWHEDELGQESCPRCASDIIEIVGIPH